MEIMTYNCKGISICINMENKKRKKDKERYCSSTTSHRPLLKIGVFVLLLTMAGVGPFGRWLTGYSQHVSAQRGRHSLHFHTERDFNIPGESLQVFYISKNK